MFSTPLEAAVAQLKADGKIRSAADIGRALDYSRGTISAYMSGKTQASQEFLTLFEDHYKVSLQEFAGKAVSPRTQTDERHSQIEKALAGREQEPLVQIIFNLTYIGRKDADTVNKLADARLIDSQTISKLVEMAFANSDNSNKANPKQHQEQHTGGVFGDLREERARAKKVVKKVG